MPILHTMARSPYNADPATESYPLSILEVQSLVAQGGKPVAGDKGRTLHFMKRVAATIQSLEGRVTALNQQLTLTQHAKAASGKAPTSHPKDMIRFLSPEELAEVVGGWLRDQVLKLVAQRDAILDARTQASLQLTALHYAAASILEDKTIPMQVRERFSQLIDESLTQREINSPALEDPNGILDDGDDNLPEWARESPATPSEALSADDEGNAGLGDLFGDR